MWQQRSASWSFTMKAQQKRHYYSVSCHSAWQTVAAIVIWCHCWPSNHIEFIEVRGGKCYNALDSGHHRLKIERNLSPACACAPHTETPTTIVFSQRERARLEKPRRNACLPGFSPSCNLASAPLDNRMTTVLRNNGLYWWRLNALAQIFYRQRFSERRVCVCVCVLPAAEFHLQQRGREDQSAVRCQYAMVQIAQPDEALEFYPGTFGGEIIWVVPRSWVAAPNQEHSPVGRPGSPSHPHMILAAWSARSHNEGETLSVKDGGSVYATFQISSYDGWRPESNSDMNTALPPLHRWLIAPMPQWHAIICKGPHKT